MKTKILFLTLLFFTASFNLYSEQKIGFALSGGGAKGLMHIGVLKTLEENNVYPDYITGTSMGCFVGALYAMGYRASEIETLVNEINWNELFNESVPRLQLSLIEKDDVSRYLAYFPVLKKSIKIPVGLIRGTNIWNLLAKLTWNRNFDNLDIPLRCIATNLETGEAVILNHGSLADAIRASMSIPSIFTPVELDGKLLVDGGLVRNLPVLDVKNMGADYVIAINVSSPLYSKKDLNSFITIMDQTSNFITNANTSEQEKLANIVIKPNIDGVGMFSFRDIDLLVKRGEEATYELVNKIKIRKLKKFEPIKKGPEKILINKIKFEGLNKVSKNLILGIIDLKIPKKYSHEDIEKVLIKLNGTLYFNTTSYFVDDDTLIIRVNEKSENFINFGIRYDTYENISILLNTTIRNILTHGSKVSIDAIISENPTFRTIYYTPFFINSSLASKNEFFLSKYDSYSYEDNKLAVNYSYGLTYFKTSLETVFSNNYIFSIGVQKEFITINSILNSSNTFTDHYDEFLNFMFYFKYDTLDKSVFTKKGSQLKITIDIITDYLALQNNIEHSSFTKLFLQNSNYFSLSKKAVLNLSSYYGSIVTGSATMDKMFYLGGHKTNNPLILPFSGPRYMRYSGSDVFSVSSGLRYEMFPSWYVSTDLQYGKIEDNLYNLFNSKNNLFGTSLSFAYYTHIIGPIELSFMKEFSNNDFSTFLSVGFWF